MGQVTIFEGLLAGSGVLFGVFMGAYGEEDD